MKAHLDSKRSLARFVIWLSILSAGHANALCYSGHPDIDSERRDSKFVFLGKVTSSKVVMSEEEPGFIDHTDYDVAVLQSFKGKPGRDITIMSVNTSARFPMDIGQTYVLFVSVDNEGSYFVNSCGNSAVATIRAGAAKPPKSGR